MAITHLRVTLSAKLPIPQWPLAGAQLTSRRRGPAGGKRTRWSAPRLVGRWPAAGPLTGPAADSGRRRGGLGGRGYAARAHNLTVYVCPTVLSVARPGPPRPAAA